MTINNGAGGNILSKSSVGDYSYDADEQPHAVKGVTNSAGKIPSLTLETVFGGLNRKYNIAYEKEIIKLHCLDDMHLWLAVV